MIVTHKLTMDLGRAGVPPRIDVSQDDRYSRNLEIRLMANGGPFCPPKGCNLLIRYEKPDKTGGSYDALPDGSRAWRLSENLLTVALAPQVCTVPGTVHMVVSFLQNQAEISSFALLLDVHKLPKGIKPSRDYVNITGFVPQPEQAKVGQYLMVMGVDEFGRVTVMGAAGEAATLEIGRVETLEYGSEPQVTEMEGSTPAARVYQLGLPAGQPGAQGPQGATGQNGQTPVKGVDYWTEADRTAIMGDVERHIQEQLADVSQVAPEFANSIEGCTDTTKLYVLPDGYIYAYMYTKNGGTSGSANLVPSSQDFTSTAPLNGTGYMDGYYASSSSPYYGTDSACVITGWIPNHIFSKTQLPPTLYIKGAGIDPTNSHCRIQYSSDKEHIGGAQGSNIPLYYTVEELGTQYYRLTPAMRDDGYSQLGHTYGDTVSGYVRFSLLGTGENLIITFNEEIAEGPSTGSYAWTNTGRAFIATDYGDKILQLEETGEAQEKKIQMLEATAVTQGQRIVALENTENKLPDYVVEEAESVISRVMATQGSNTFLLGAISDLHYGNNHAEAGVHHAAQALAYINRRMKLDAVTVLGDYTDGYPTQNYDDAIRDFQTVNDLLDDLRTVPNLRLQGNHDYYPAAPMTVHRYINAFNDGITWGSRSGGYGYRDFADFKLRIICLNTEEVGAVDGGKNGNSIYCSAEQYNWFARALDLTGKEDASQWRILLLSHQPLDWYEQSGRYIFGQILKNYAAGTAWTAAAGDVSCDFRGKNAAKIIANIHGHVHNLLTGYIFCDTGAGTLTSVKRICTPEACTGRENQYAGNWAEVSSYPKTPDTAEDTAFCIYCIDLDSDTVHAVCYGAGYDRTVSS